MEGSYYMENIPIVSAFKYFNSIWTIRLPIYHLYRIYTSLMCHQQIFPKYLAIDKF